METRRSIPIHRLTLGALYLALFWLASNVPFLSGIQIIPQVPVTLQTFLIAMMGLTLGVRGGLVSYASLLILTFCGLPMMAGGRGGPPVFVGPTSGYIYGWVFIILLLGLYSTRWMDALIQKKWRGMSIHIPVSFALGMVGVLLDYACGTLGVIAFGTGGNALSAFPVLFASNLGYLPGDMVKIGLASSLSLSLFAKPTLRRLLQPAVTYNAKG